MADDTLGEPVTRRGCAELERPRQRTLHTLFAGAFVAPVNPILVAVLPRIASRMFQPPAGARAAGGIINAHFIQQGAGKLCPPSDRELETRNRIPTAGGCSVARVYKCDLTSAARFQKVTWWSGSEDPWRSAESIASTGDLSANYARASGGLARCVKRQKQLNFGGIDK